MNKCLHMLNIFFYSSFHLPIFGSLSPKKRIQECQIGAGEFDPDCIKIKKESNLFKGCFVKNKIIWIEKNQHIKVEQFESYFSVAKMEGNLVKYVFQK